MTGRSRMPTRVHCSRYSAHSGPPVLARSTSNRHFSRNLRKCGWFGHDRAQFPCAPDSTFLRLRSVRGSCLSSLCLIKPPDPRSKHYGRSSARWFGRNHHSGVAERAQLLGVQSQYALGSWAQARPVQRVRLWLGLRIDASSERRMSV